MRYLNPCLKEVSISNLLALKLEANPSGIRFKSGPFEAVGIASNLDAQIVANYKNHDTVWQLPDRTAPEQAGRVHRLAAKDTLQ